MPENTKMELKGTDRLVGVDGIPINVCGTVSVKISLETLTFNQKFVIADGITAEAILGMDFLEANKCVFNIFKGELVAKDKGMIPLQPHSSSERSCHKVNLVETTVIPAASEIEVTAKVCTPNDNHVWIIEGKMVKVPIRVARALVKLHKNLIPLRIINTNLTPVKLYKGSTLAHAECADEASINVVSQNAEEWILQVSAKHCDSHTSYDYIEDMILGNISEDHREKILALLQLYSDVIACDDYDLGRTGILTHSIDTGNAIPIRQQVQRMSLPAKEKVRQLLKNTMDKKVI